MNGEFPSSPSDAIHGLGQQSSIADHNQALGFQGKSARSGTLQLWDSKTQMLGFKRPGFQERQEAAALAKSAALAAYRARPPVDEALMAERAARRKAREAAEAEKRAAARRAKEEAAAAKRERELRAAAEAEAAAKAEADAIARTKADAKAQKIAERKNWTEEDRKAARDARYAARKARQGRH